MDQYMKEEQRVESAMEKEKFIMRMEWFLKEDLMKVLCLDQEFFGIRMEDFVMKEITKMIREAMENHKNILNPTVSEILTIEKETYEFLGQKLWEN